MIISMIIAYGKNKELGLKNKLLWSIPEDLENFKRITTGHHLLMGRNTYESIFEYIKKPLPNRESLVLTSKTINDSFENVNKFTSFEDAITFAAERGEKELFIIGGASIYNKYFDKISKIYISEVDYEGPADCFFEKSLDSQWKEIETKEYKSIEKIPSWKFRVYERE